MGEGLGSGAVLIASNRGPVSFRLDNDGRLSTRRGGGGLVSGLSSVASRGNSLWICAALSDADRSAARSAPQGRLGLDGKPGGSEVRLLDIPPATFQRAYNSVANSTLWFVHHMLYNTPSKPRFGMGFRREWESFRAYNRAFADALAQEASSGGPAGHSLTGTVGGNGGSSPGAGTAGVYGGSSPRAGTANG